MREERREKRALHWFLSKQQARHEKLCSGGPKTHTKLYVRGIKKRIGEMVAHKFFWLF